MRRTIVLLADAPIPGLVKAGLCPPLESSAAAHLHQCFLLDAVEKACAVPDAELVVSYSPHGSLSFFREMVPEAAGYLPHSGNGTAGRVRDCIRSLGEPGRSLVVFGTDTPTLPIRCLELAFDALATKQVDVVFGPTADFGFYLTGTSASHTCLPWISQWGVAARAIEDAASEGMGWYLLPEWHGVAAPADLAWLKGELLDRSVTGPLAKHTRAYLWRLARDGKI